MAVQRFYWLIDSTLAGCSRPGGVARNGDNPEESVRADLAWLRDQGIRGVLTLTETAIPPEIADDFDLDVLHLPIPDMRAPMPEDFAVALDFIDRQRAMGHPVAVHCLMGQGRTGTILAAYLIRDGLPADAAIAQLRALCPGAIEAGEQRKALQDFARARPWIV
jgi:atypical dual specificity phosphatase